MKFLLALLLALPTTCFSQGFSEASAPFLLSTSSLRRGLVGYWRLEEASGTRYDCSKYGNALSSNNNAGQSVGRVGNCVSLVKTSSQSLSVPSNASLQTGDIDFTVAGWFKAITLAAASAFNGMLSRWDTGGNDEWLLYYDGSAARFKFAVSTSGTSVSGSVTASNFGAPATNTWYFIVCIHDSIANQLYINVNNGTANTVGWSGGVVARSATFDIGRHDVSGTAQYWDGLVDEVGYWKRRLTASELTFLYNAGLGTHFPWAHP